MSTPLFHQTFLQGPPVALHLLPTEAGTKWALFQQDSFEVSFFARLSPSLETALIDWLLAYSEKKETKLLSLPRQFLPPFSEKVLEALQSVPFGKTLSYGDLSLLAGIKGASRAVGTICRRNPWPLFIPCHRVLPHSGEIGNYAFGSPIKKALLEFESAL